ncbi:hypothetical protein MKX03_036110 [Papaver bracteatum]|nr:hypothetical protein MKX03_036110 [Papaver bracteatum]
MAFSSTASDYNHSSDVELVEEVVVRSELVEEEDLLKFPEIPAIRIPERSECSSNNNNSSSNQNAWATPRSRQSSPRSPTGFRDKFGLLASSSSNTSHGSPPLQATRFSNLYNNRSNSSNLNSWNFLKIFGVFLKKNPNQQQMGLGLVINKSKGKTSAAGRVWYRKKRVRGLVVIIVLIGFFFLMNWWMLSRLPDDSSLNSNHGFLNVNSSSVRGEWSKFGNGKRPHRVLFSRMLDLAAHSLAEGESKAEPKDLWLEPLLPVSAWKRCAEVRNWEPNEGRNGYIIVSANGDMNQQRVAVCNAVTLARLLNSTLVVPKILFSSVWRDVRFPWFQFDMIDEEHRCDLVIIKLLEFGRRMFRWQFLLKVNMTGCVTRSKTMLWKQSRRFSRIILKLLKKGSHMTRQQHCIWLYSVGEISRSWRRLLNSCNRKHLNAKQGTTVTHPVILLPSMVEYLYSVTRDENRSPFSGQDGVRLLQRAIDSNFFGLALCLVRRYPELVTEKLLKTDMCALDGGQLTWLQKRIYPSKLITHHPNYYILRQKETFPPNLFLY